MERKILRYLVPALLSCQIPAVHAAFVESAIGNAVVNDATAIYFNPAALTLIPNKQLVGIESLASVLTTFNGRTVQRSTGFTQTGGTNSRTHYNLPSWYLSIPINSRLTAGIGFLYTFYGISNFPSNSIVRYAQTYNSISTLDVIPAFGLKLTDKFSAGAGADLEFGDIELDSESGFPSLGIRDVKSTNKASATGWGAHAGLLYQPRRGTLLGFTYHSAVSYNFRGTSKYGTVPQVYSPNLYLGAVTPPSWVLSISQFFTPQFNLVGTIQRMNWGTVRNLNLQNVAFKFGSLPATILPSVVIPYYLHNSTRYTLGGNYAVTEQWTVRGSGSLDEDPTNRTAGIATGNNIILSIGTGYKFTKLFTFDFTYAHVFYRTLAINSIGPSNIITGTTDGGRDYLVGKVTFNL